MIGADVHRVPFRRLARRKQDQILGQPQRRAGREHVGAARQIFLDDVVLRRALQAGARRALFVGDGDIERHQPAARRVDRHRRVHRRERECRRAARACRRDARSRRRPCRPRRGRAGGRCHSRSASADRRRSTGRSGPWRDWRDRACSIRPRSNGRHRCGKSRACRAWRPSPASPETPSPSPILCRAQSQKTRGGELPRQRSGPVACGPRNTKCGCARTPWR